MAVDARRAGARALVEAQRLLQAIGLDQARPIDVFRLILEEGITLDFTRYRKLAGAYIPGSDDLPPIITINEGHPLALQRYTAAHELGHHVAHSDSVCDTDVEILARGVAPRTYDEAFAESFASWLLMPRQLVHARVRALALPAHALGPEDVYRLALDLGTSYDATLTQLGVLHLLSFPQQQALRRIPPKDTKERLAGGPRANARTDVWRVAEGDEWGVLRAKIGDDVILELPEAPSTSYLWEPVGWPAALAGYATDFDPPTERGYDAAGLRRVRFSVATAGEWPLRLELRSPYDAEPAEIRSLLLAIAPPFRPSKYLEPEQLALSA